MSSWSRFTHRNASRQPLRAPCSRPDRSASPPEGPPRPVTPDARGDRSRPAGTARRGPASRAVRRARCSVLTSANARRRSAPAGNPCRYQAMCLRMSRMPLSSPKWAAQQFAVAAHDRRRPRPVWAVSHRSRPANASDSSANNHGLPRQPRPMTTPSQPVAGHHRQRVVCVEDVAVAEHRNAGDVLLECGDLLPVGAYRSNAGRRCGHAARRPRRLLRRRCGRRRGGCGGRRRCRSGTSP